MALIDHRKSPALTRLITLYARARMERSGRAMAPPAPRRFFFTSSLAVELIDLHASSSTSAPSRSTGRCRARGSASTTPLRRSTETGLLAALAVRFGGSADGADRSQKIARVNPLDHPLRAREDGAIRACDGPTGAAPILFHLFAGGGADRPARIELDQVDRPLPSYGVSFDNTPFAAALRL